MAASYRKYTPVPTAAASNYAEVDMKTLRLISFASLIAIACIANAIAQNNKTEPAALPEYVLEVTRPDGCVVSPISPKTKSGTVLYALPRAAKHPRDNSGQPITSKVLVWARFQNEQWRVRVSVGTGEFYDAGDYQAGDFKLNVNERANVPEVNKFGLSSLRVGVMKIVRQPAGKPQFVNFTQSVSLESIEANKVPDPFKLHLKNNSAQDLIAIQYNNFGMKGFIGLEWLSPGLLTPLIKSGETYKLEVKSEDKSCGDDEGYSPNQLRKIDFVTAVFADGTYEGQHGLAALVKGMAVGNRRNLASVVGTIGEITEADELAQQLDNLQQAMNEEAEPYLVETLRAMFPALPADAPDVLNNYIRSGMHEVKVNLLRDAHHLRALSKQNNPERSKRAVEETKAKYERWWAAAQKMTSQ